MTDWYLTQGGDWRRSIDEREEPIIRLFNRYAEDYVNDNRTAEWLEKMCDEAIERHAKRQPQPNESPFRSFDYLEHKRAGIPAEGAKPAMIAILGS